MSVNWSVSGGIEALSGLAGIHFDLMFSNLNAIATAYRSACRREFL